MSDSQWVVTVLMPSNEETEVNLLDERDSLDEALPDLQELFKENNAGAKAWVTTVCYLWQIADRPGDALSFAEQGVQHFTDIRSTSDAIPLYCQLVTYNVALSRKAYKFILGTAKNQLKPDKDKAYYLGQASSWLAKAQLVDKSSLLVKEASLLVALVSGKFDHVTQQIANLRSLEKNNLLAFYAQGRVEAARRKWRPALKQFQEILLRKPQFLPDPRIGIGICNYMLGDRNAAKRAWEASLKKNPGFESQGALVCLGILTLNESREAARIGDEDLGAELYTKYTQLFQTVFRADNTNAVAAYMLAWHFLQQSAWESAIKLAERAIQYADVKSICAEAYYVLGRAYHALGDRNKALLNYAQAVQDKPDFMLARLASAHLFVANGEIPNALNTFQMALDKHPNCIEAHVGLAVLHIHNSFARLPQADTAEERKKALEHYEAINRFFNMAETRQAGVDPILLKRIRVVADDPDLFVEMARLCTESQPAKALEHYQVSLRVRKDHQERNALNVVIPPHLHNNIGALIYLKRDFKGALEHFQTAFQLTAQTKEADQDAVLMTVVYNLAMTNEALGNTEAAESIYRQRILDRHPEFIEAKARLALMHVARKDYDAAHELIKEALTSSPKNSEIRALYTYFLCRTGQDQVARDFTTATVREVHRQDVYAFCALGLLLYQQAREMKPKESDTIEIQRKLGKFYRSAEFYDKALRLDPQCSFAAMGIAISLAEGSLVPPTVLRDPAKRSAAYNRNSRDAINILTKVRDTMTSTSDMNAAASVYINLGHTHASREEWDKAIEAYETALKRFYGGSNAACLLYLSRAWYHKANNTHQFSAVKHALQHCQKALELLPRDDSIRFNMGIIQHKGLEIIGELSSNRRNVAQIKEAIAQAEEAQAIFTHLASVDPKTPTPYPLDLAQQRLRFGAIQINKAKADTLVAQEQYEREEQARQEATREQREAERLRQQQLEEARLEQIRQKNAALAEERRRLQEAAKEWMEASKAHDSDDEPKQRKRAPKKKAAEEGAPVASGDEGQEKPKAKRPPKRKNPAKPKAVSAPEGEGADGTKAEEEEEDEEMPAMKKRRPVKSTEFVETDEDE